MGKEKKKNWRKMMIAEADETQSKGFVFPPTLLLLAGQSGRKEKKSRTAPVGLIGPSQDGSSLDVIAHF